MSIDIGGSTDFGGIDIVTPENTISLSTIFQDTADAIRIKTGSTDQLYPVNYATAISSIESGSDVSSSKYYLNKCILNSFHNYL